MTHLTFDDASAASQATRVPLAAGRAQVVVDVTLDLQELGQRKRRGAQPILNLDLLNLLLTMPLSTPVPARSVSDYEWRRLKVGRRMGAVDISRVDGHLCTTRRATPAVKVRHVTVAACQWRSGLSIASRYAPYGSRDLVLDRLPADDLELRLEADYLGIGICVRGDGPDAPVSRIIEPAPFLPARYTGASWLFAERLLAQQTMLDS